MLWVHQVAVQEFWVTVVDLHVAVVAAFVVWLVADKNCPCIQISHIVDSLRMFLSFCFVMLMMMLWMWGWKVCVVDGMFHGGFGWCASWHCCFVLTLLFCSPLLPSHPVAAAASRSILRHRLMQTMCLFYRQSSIASVLKKNERVLFRHFLVRRNDVAMPHCWVWQSNFNNRPHFCTYHLLTPIVENYESYTSCWVVRKTYLYDATLPPKYEDDYMNKTSSPIQFII